MTNSQSWDELKQLWTNQYVSVDENQPQWHRFAKLIGRVVTVNGSHRCIVDFQDGGWYDIEPHSLKICSDQEEAAKRYSFLKNSAQAIPHRQA